MSCVEFERTFALPGPEAATSRLATPGAPADSVVRTYWVSAAKILELPLEAAAVVTAIELAVTSWREAALTSTAPLPVLARRRFPPVAEIVCRVSAALSIATSAPAPVAAPVRDIPERALIDCVPAPA